MNTCRQEQLLELWNRRGQKSRVFLEKFLSRRGVEEKSHSLCADGLAGFLGALNPPARAQFRGDRMAYFGTQALRTACCITGGGPAGMMLGFLLARAGVDVVV